MFLKPCYNVRDLLKCYVSYIWSAMFIPRPYVCPEKMTIDSCYMYMVLYRSN